MSLYPGPMRVARQVIRRCADTRSCGPRPLAVRLEYQHWHTDKRSRTRRLRLRRDQPPVGTQRVEHRLANCRCRAQPDWYLIRGRSKEPEPSRHWRSESVHRTHRSRRVRRCPPPGRLRRGVNESAARAAAGHDTGRSRDRRRRGGSESPSLARASSAPQVMAAGRHKRELTD